jgi:hypothetical protein
MDSEYLSTAKQTAEKVIYVLLFLLLLYSGPSVKLNFVFYPCTPGEQELVLICHKKKGRTITGPAYRPSLPQRA